jgi:hypothetical protein
MKGLKQNFLLPAHFHYQVLLLLRLQTCALSLQRILNTERFQDLFFFGLGFFLLLDLKELLAVLLPPLVEAFD